MAMSVRARQALLLGAWWVAFPGAASAQVNVEPLRREIAESGVAAHLALSVASYAGNTRGITLGALALIGGRHGRHSGYAHGTVDYSHLGGTTQAAKAFGHIRHNYDLVPRVWSELYAQMEADRFRRLALRELFGAGSRFQLRADPSSTLFYGLSYMLEYTRLSAAAGVPDRSSVAHRASNYLAFDWIPDERATFAETLYVQPRIDRPADVHLLSVTSLAFRISSRLSSRIDATVRYDTRHPDRVQAYDVEVKNSLAVRF